MEGSTKIIIGSSQGVVNRLDYDHLGNLRNQTAPPQVELLWKRRYLNSELDAYIDKTGFCDPNLGISIKIYPFISADGLYRDMPHPGELDPCFQAISNYRMASYQYSYLTRVELCAHGHYMSCTGIGMTYLEAIAYVFNRADEFDLDISTAFTTKKLAAGDVAKYCGIVTLEINTFLINY